MPVKELPRKVCSSIVDSILAKYHTRLSDEPSGSEKTPPSVKTRTNLEKLKGLALEEFSSENFPGLDQEIVMSTLARPENKFRHLDLSNLKVSNLTIGKSY